MEFDKSKVYTAVNADELKVGSKVICANNLKTLKKKVVIDEDVQTLKEVWEADYEARFEVEGLSFSYRYHLAYLVSEPEEKKLKWTDLKIGDVIRKKYKNGYRFASVIRIDTYTTERHIGLGGEWLYDDNLEDWEKVEEQND